jgi:hypothetical protein
MKDQYVGDIGDFGKVLLLKHLVGLGFKIGINWVLTENDQRADGKHRDYASYSGGDCLCCCDDKVFEQMLPLAKKEKADRKIEDLEDLIRGFSERVVFYSKKYVGGRKRKTSEDEAFAALSPDLANLAFFDPDNGVDGEEGTSSKHVYISDLSRYWKRKQSILTYHHLSREDTHEKQIDKLRIDFTRAFPESRVYTYHLRRGTARVYILCIRKEHLPKIVGKDAISAIQPLNMTKEAWSKRSKYCDKNHPAKSAPTPKSSMPPLPEMLLKGNWSKASKNLTTQIGYVNKNGQVVIRNTKLPGTDHGQFIYQLGCSHCGHTYGANGSDIHLRKCPNCQGGAIGLSLE